jgi:L-iditol 2-dehydrogenase
MNARAAQLVEDGRFDLVPLVLPPTGHGMVLVRTLIASVCGSDLHVVDHDWGDPTRPARPGFPGHESVVEILDDPAGRLASGDRALAVPPAGNSAAFATHQLVAHASLIPLRPDDVAERTVFAQQLGTVIHAMNVFRHDPLDGQTVGIVGAGSAGAMFVNEARRRGAAAVLVSDPHESRRALARALGAVAVVDRGELSEAVHDATHGTGAALMIEAGGTDDGRNEAISALAPDGTLGVFGLPERIGPSPIDVGTLFTRRGRLVTTHSAQSEPGIASFREALTQVRDGSFDPDVFETRSLPLEDIDVAFELARRRGGVHKALLDLDES